MSICVANDTCITYEVISTGPDTGSSHWIINLADPQSSLGSEVPSSTNQNGLRCVEDPLDSTRSVLFMPEHTSRTSIDVDGGSYTPDFERGVPATIAAADLNVYNLHSKSYAVVNPSSGREFCGLFVFRTGATITIGANTYMQLDLETGFGTPPADFTSTGAVTLGSSITARWGFWENGGANAFAHSTSPLVDNPAFNLAPGMGFTYWGRMTIRQLNFGAMNGATVSNIDGLAHFSGSSK